MFAVMAAEVAATVAVAADMAAAVMAAEVTTAIMAAALGVGGSDWWFGGCGGYWCWINGVRTWCPNY